MERHLVAIVQALPGSRVVYRDDTDELGFFIDPVVLWGHYRERPNDSEQPYDMVYGITSNELGLTETDDGNVIGYLLPGEPLNDDWWMRHGGKPKP